MPVLPDDPVLADLEAAYALRGGALVNCDAARDLAVQTLLSERSLIDQWNAMQNPKRSIWTRIWSH